MGNVITCRSRLWFVLAFGLLLAATLWLLPAQALADGPTCYARVGASSPYTSSDASAVQQAVDAAADGDLVKVAGYCQGVQARDGLTQTVYISKAITLQGGYSPLDWLTPDPELHPTTLDANGLGRVVVITDGVPGTLADLSVVNGYWATGSAAGLAYGPVTLTHVNVLSNTAEEGLGGLAVWGDVTAVGGLFQGNRSGLCWCWNGALGAVGNLTATDSRFVNNWGGIGASVIASGTITLMGGSFENNEAVMGPAVVAMGPLIVTGTQFFDNAATRITTTVGLGGACMVQSDGPVHIVNALFAGNTAAGGGALFYKGTGVSDILFSTIVGADSPHATSAVYVGGGTLHMTNTIVASYTIPISAEVGSSASEDYNLFFNTGPSLGPVTSGSHHPVGDPRFVRDDTGANPADGDYHLRAGSPAINAGIDLGVDTDLEDHVRPQGGGFDLGAFESPYGAADLALAKTGPTLIIAGQTVTYTVVMTNNGPGLASQATIVDALPASLSLVGTEVTRSITGSLSCDGAVCRAARVTMGEVVTMTVAALVDPNLPFATWVTNTAIVASVDDSDTDNNSASQASHTAFQPRLSPKYLYFPLVLHNFLAPDERPDLVASFAVTARASVESMGVTAIITNQGATAAGPFWVDFYTNPDPVPNRANVIWPDTCSLSPCYGIAWHVPSLAAGESIVLTSSPNSYDPTYTNWADEFAPGTTDLYLYADSWQPGSPSGAVLESNETNNRAELHAKFGIGKPTQGAAAPRFIPPRPAP